MATLSNDDLAEIRRKIEAKFNLGASTINYDKGTVNAAIQVLEDWYQDQKAVVSASVNSATSPFVFSNAAKKALGAYYFEYRFKQDKGG